MIEGGEERKGRMGRRHVMRVEGVGIPRCGRKGPNFGDREDQTSSGALPDSPTPTPGIQEIEASLTCPIPFIPPSSCLCVPQSHPYLCRAPPPSSSLGQPASSRSPTA